MSDSKEWTIRKHLKSIRSAEICLLSVQNFLKCQNFLNCQRTGNIAGGVTIQFDGVGGNESRRNQRTGLNQKERTTRNRPFGEHSRNVQPLMVLRSTCRVLNRYLSIPKAAILESSVCLGSPSLAAAPVGPATWPPQSANARSIMSFSRSNRVASKGTVGPVSRRPSVSARSRQQKMCRSRTAQSPAR